MRKMKNVPELKYYSKIKQGHLVDLNKHELREALKTFEGCTVSVTFKENKQMRSIELNNFLFGCVYRNALEGFRNLNPIYNSYTTTDIHYFFKDKFKDLLEWETKDFIDFETGEVLTIQKPTTRTSNFILVPYVESVIEFCKEFLNIPAKYFDSDHYKRTKEKYYAKQQKSLITP